MEINKIYDNDELVMQVEGRIDTISSQELEKNIKDENHDYNSLIMDFEKVEYISSAGLRVLIATQKRLKKENKSLIIRNVNDIIKEIFRMSGFDKILLIQ